MARYKKLLLAVDFHSDNVAVIDKAMEVKDDNGAELLLVHVNEPLAAAYTADGMASWGDQLISLEAGVRQEAQKRMNELAQQLNVEASNCYVREGKASDEIHELVKEQDVDLIVMGTHGQHGFKLLLGSTATSVLHGVSCDVLTVRLKES